MLERYSQGDKYMRANSLVLKVAFLGIVLLTISGCAQKDSISLKTYCNSLETSRSGYEKALDAYLTSFELKDYEKVDNWNIRIWATSKSLEERIKGGTISWADSEEVTYWLQRLRDDFDLLAYDNARALDHEDDFTNIDDTFNMLLSYCKQ